MTFHSLSVSPSICWDSEDSSRKLCRYFSLFWKLILLHKQVASNNFGCGNFSKAFQLFVHSKWNASDMCYENFLSLKNKNCCQREGTQEKTIQSHWNINRAILVRNQNQLATYNSVACYSHLFINAIGSRFWMSSFSIAIEFPP